MSSKASLRERERTSEKKKQVENRKQSVRVLVIPRKKWARIVLTTVRTELRHSTIMKIFAAHSKYIRKLRKTNTHYAIKHINGGIFSPRYIEMTVLKVDVDRQSQKSLDIIFELEGRRRHAETNG